MLLVIRVNKPTKTSDCQFYVSLTMTWGKCYELGRSYHFHQLPKSHYLTSLVPSMLHDGREFNQWQIAYKTTNRHKYTEVWMIKWPMHLVQCQVYGPHVHWFECNTCNLWQFGWKHNALSNSYKTWDQLKLKYCWKFRRGET